MSLRWNTPTRRSRLSARATASSRDSPSTLHRGLDHVADHRHVRPQVEVLEHHREPGPQALQLLRVARDECAVAPGHERHFLAVAQHDASRRCGASSRLMQRSSVLLPEPLAPITAITSPAAAASVTPLSTSRAP